MVSVPRAYFDSDLPVCSQLRYRVRYARYMEYALLITVDPDIMSGTPVFRGTRVPVETLIDYIEDGFTLDNFLEQFPTVPRRTAIAVLEHLKSGLVESSH